MSQEEVAQFLASVRALDERSAREDAARTAKMKAGIADGRAAQARLLKKDIKAGPPPPLPVRQSANSAKILPPPVRRDCIDTETVDFDKLDRRERELEQERARESARIAAPARADKFRKLQQEKCARREAAEASSGTDAKAQNQADIHAKAQAKAALDAKSAFSNLPPINRALASALMRNAPPATRLGPEHETRSNISQIPVPPRPRNTANKNSEQAASDSDELPSMEIRLINPVARTKTVVDGGGERGDSSVCLANRTREHSLDRSRDTSLDSSLGRSLSRSPDHSLERVSTGGKPSWLASALTRNLAPEPVQPVGRSRPIPLPPRGRQLAKDEPPELPIRPKSIRVAPDPAPDEIAAGAGRLRSADCSPIRSRSLKELPEKAPRDSADMTAEQLKLLQLRKAKPPTPSKQQAASPQPHSPAATLRPAPKLPERAKNNTDAYVELTPDVLRKTERDNLRQSRQSAADAYVERSPESLRKAERASRYTGADAYVERSPESLRKAEKASRYTGADAFVERSSTTLRPVQKRIPSVQKPPEALQRLQQLREKSKGTTSDTKSANVEEELSTVTRTRTEPCFAANLDSVLANGSLVYSQSSPALNRPAGKVQEIHEEEKPLVHLVRTRTRGPKRRLPGQKSSSTVKSGPGSQMEAERQSLQPGCESPNKPPTEPKKSERPQTEPLPSSISKLREKSQLEDTEARKERQRRVASIKKPPVSPRKT